MFLTEEQSAENHHRAQRARNALHSYSLEEDTDPDSLLVDLLVDLMHLYYIDYERADFQAALDSARRHFEAEINGEL
jgi:hypothetical protein